MTECEFWDSTAYLTGLHVDAYADRIKTQREAALLSGWASERFAREKVLQPLAHYLKGEGDVAEEATVESVREWAASWKLKPSKVEGARDAGQGTG